MIDAPQPCLGVQIGFPDIFPFTSLIIIDSANPEQKPTNPPVVACLSFPFPHPLLGICLLLTGIYFFSLLDPLLEDFPLLLIFSQPSDPATSRLLNLRPFP